MIESLFIWNAREIYYRRYTELARYIRYIIDDRKKESINRPGKKPARRLSLRSNETKSTKVRTKVRSLSAVADNT